MTFGIWISVLPYLGFPIYWKNILFTLTGLILIYFSFLIYKEHRISQFSKEKNFENFSENSNFEIVNEIDEYGERN